MGLPLRDSQRHSYGKYRTWPEDVRYELIDGVAYAMSPAPVQLAPTVGGRAVAPDR